MSSKIPVFDLSIPAVTCPNCKKCFSSRRIEYLVSNKIYLDDGLENCPYCHLLFSRRIFKIYENNGRIEYCFDDFENAVNSSDSSNSLFAKNGALYISPKFTPQKKISSAVWKIWKQNRNVYVASNSFPEFKISIHNSGQDNLSFISNDAFPNLTNLPNGRHVFSAIRNVCPLGRFMRIFRIEIKYNDFYWPGWNNWSKGAKKDGVLLIDSPHPNFVIEGLYTSCTLERFSAVSGRTLEELYSNLLYSTQIRDNEWIHITAGSIEEPLDHFEPQIWIDRKTKDLRTLVASLGMGKVNNNTLGVRLIHSVTEASLTSD